ncbi:g10573 [Coccomyxa viridis]|uniref:RNA polymerase II subunit A C-terminal domain phosphatase SSU72 n=1 Tax=Coccomyxa viridis TaxID=1274662 RepID=A0ABP1G636_9CHLO
MGRIKFAMVCAANQNRSMEAHALLKEHGFEVGSFGINGHVKLPGPTQHQPNVYNFGTPYEVIYRDLRSKDEAFYEQKGLLQMLQRNMSIKLAPQRWQDNQEQFDVVIVFEERLMDNLLEDFNSKAQSSLRPLLVINIDVQDSHEEAAKVAPQALKLCTMLEEREWQENVDGIMADFEREHGRRLLYTICFY